MDKYFIHFDQEGNFLGRYISAHSEIPSDAVEVSQSLFHQTIDETDGVWKIDRKTGEIAKHPFPPPPPPTPAEIEAAKVAIVQRHMDEAAQALRYDDIATAVTYADEPSIPKFQAEGQAFRAWRSLVWAKCYEILADVQDGKRDIPTDEDLISELPELILPETV